MSTKAGEVKSLHMRAAISCSVKFAFSLAIIITSLRTQPAHALIFGEIKVISRVGEPLLAYVPVSPDRPYEKITTSCFSLIKAGMRPPQERPNLSAARLELIGDKKIGQRIKISTSAPVNARSLTFQLKARCVVNGLIIREFKLELEPEAKPLSAALPAAKPGSESGAPSRDGLFGYDVPVAEKSFLTSGWKGFAQFDLARMYRDPQHWSNERLRLDLSR